MAQENRNHDLLERIALGDEAALEELVKEKLGCKVRSIELNLPQRCAAHLASKTDITESVGVGMSAVEAAIKGKTGVMMTIYRADDEIYSVYFDSADISGIANGVKQVPREYINSEGNGITEDCIKYLAPLILGEVFPEYENGLPKHIVI